MSDFRKTFLLPPEEESEDIVEYPLIEKDIKEEIMEDIKSDIKKQINEENEDKPKIKDNFLKLIEDIIFH